MGPARPAESGTGGRARRLQVVQWATGNIGLRSLRAVIDHPALDLVGLLVHASDKVGRDAGELCGTATTGVVATDSIDDIVALGADCVLYMGDRPAHDLVAALLESGTNVVTTRTDYQRPASMEPVVRDRLEAACQRGGTSLHGTGSSPGFSTEALPLALLSLQRRLDQLTIDEFADLSLRESPNLLFDLMGFGRRPDEFDAGRWAHGAASFGPSLGVIADAVGLSFDDIESVGEVATATETIEIAAGTIEAGTVAAQRMVVTGTHAGLPVMRLRTNWYCSDRIDPAWDLRSTGWRVQVDGDTPLDVQISFPVPPERWAATSPGLTAHRAVNAVPCVCAAEPGIRTTVDLPHVIPDLSLSE